MRGIVLLLAAGEGTRLGSSGPKALAELDGVPLALRSFEAIERAELVDGLVVAVPVSHERRFTALLPPRRLAVEIVAGGPTRQASAAAALAAAPEAEAYLVHDAARPLAPPALFDAVLRELDTCEAACPVLPLRDTVKRTEGGRITETLDRAHLAAAQTPQGFRAGVYRRALEAAAADAFDGTDDAVLAERIGVEVRMVPGDDRNVKITTAHDLAVASALLGVPR